MIIAPEAITSNGWLLHEKCRCNNIRKYKFRHPEYPDLELEWWISYHQFKVMQGNTTKIPLTKIGQADSVLKSLQ
jgi:hypothetical protein